MKGCPVALRDIVFADDEVLPAAHVAGHIHSLRFMPISLLLQVEDAVWQLPDSELPCSLPSHVSKRGLF